MAKSSSDRAIEMGRAALAAPVQPGSPAAKISSPVAKPNAAAKPSNFKGYTSAERNKLTDAQKAAIDNPQAPNAAELVAGIPGSVTAERNARLGLTEEQRNAIASGASVGANPEITAQPSPYAAQIAPPNATPGTGELNYQEAQANLNKGGLSGNSLAMATDSLKARYGMGLAKTKAAGTQVSDSQGLANTTITANTPGNQPETPSAWPQVFDIDPNIDKGFVEFDDWMSPPKQKETLLEQYTSMTKALGIADINAEMINIKNVIDGNEDMIRSEIAAAGGFGTDGQVMAMTNARNKSLIINYNKLVDLKTSTMQQLETMMDLSIKDRQMAEAEFDRKMNYAFKAAEFRERATNNAKQTYMTLGDKMGWDTLFNSMSPYDQGIAQKTMGITPQQAQQLALRSSQDRIKAEQEQMLDLDIKRGQLDLQKDNLLTNEVQRNAAKGYYDKPGDKAPAIQTVNGQSMVWDSKSEKFVAAPTSGSGGFISPSVINSQTGKVDPRNQLSSVINSTGAKTDDKLKLTGAVISTAQAFAERNSQGKFAGLGFGQIVPGFLANQTQQSNRTDLSSLEGTVESWMTGASVAVDQAKRIKEEMIPKRGDPDWQTRSKINALTNYMMNYAAGNLATQGINFAPQPVDFFSNPVVPGDDGNDYEIVQPQ